MKKRLLFGLLAYFFISIAYAQTSFIVQHVQIEGLQGLSQETVLSYLPVKTGETITEAKTSQILQSLYNTGFFDNISLSRKGDTLIVKVDQRPIISKITVSGNKAITTNQLYKALQDLKFSEGGVFDSSSLEKIKTSLKSSYFAIGKYNAKVDIDVVKQPGNRVFVNIIISEGKVSKIHQIEIIGNHAFSENELLKQFKLTTPGILTIFTHEDQYSKEKLAADLESLRSYYMDRGYLNFKINSSEVSISPDKKQVYIIVNITEGPQYKLSGYNFSGNLILSKQELQKYVDLKPGQVFSRKDVISTNKNISSALGAIGYADANISTNPKVDEKNRTIFLTINIDPGHRVYVRHVTFSGNYKVNDNVLRREILQPEGAEISTKNIDTSKSNLLLLPYIRDVQVTTTPVPGKPNLEDVDYKITEQPSAELKAGIGYSVLEKLTVNASITQKNVLGTGNALSLAVNASRPEKDVAISYDNPYITTSGIGRSISVYTTHFDSSKANISNYATNTYGLNVGYSFPLSLRSAWHLGFGYENNLLNIGKSPSKELKRFVDAHGRHFYQVNLNTGWTKNGLDRVVFPRKGGYQSLSAHATAPISGDSLEYYTLSYQGTYYHPLYKSFIGQLRGNINYGNGYGRFGGRLPFFKNFFAGGIGSVRGFEGNTLGPKDSNNDPLGGNFELDGTAGVVFPNPFSNSVRTTWFVDGGNAYHNVKLSKVRFSSGIEVDWLSPIAMFNFSLATPIRRFKGDDTEVFQFNIGSSF